MNPFRAETRIRMSLNAGESFLIVVRMRHLVAAKIGNLEINAH